VPSSFNSEGGLEGGLFDNFVKDSEADPGRGT